MTGVPEECQKVPDPHCGNPLAERGSGFLKKGVAKLPKSNGKK